MAGRHRNRRHWVLGDELRLGTPTAVAALTYGGLSARPDNSVERDMSTDHIPQAAFPDLGEWVRGR